MIVTPLRPPVARLCFLDDPVINGCVRLQMKLMKLPQAHGHRLRSITPLGDDLLDWMRVGGASGCPTPSDLKRIGAPSLK